jgi:hypothetical protein
MGTKSACNKLLLPQKRCGIPSKKTFPGSASAGTDAGHRCSGIRLNLLASRPSNRGYPWRIIFASKIGFKSGHIAIHVQLRRHQLIQGLSKQLHAAIQGERDVNPPARHENQRIFLSTADAFPPWLRRPTYDDSGEDALTRRAPRFRDRRSGSRAHRYEDEPLRRNRTTRWSDVNSESR